MNSIDKVAVCSRSFSKNEVLRGELLEKYSCVRFNDEGIKLEGRSLVDFLQGCSKVIIALERIDDAVLQKLPELEVVSKYGVGLDMIDFAAMNRHGKKIGWTGGVNRRSVSELVLSFAISMLRHLPRATNEVRKGIWRQHIGGQLSGRTIGIIGCGFVGKDLVRLLNPFGCEILANDIRDYPGFYRKHAVQPVSLDDLLSRSDIVTLHVPLDRSTCNILDKSRLALMNSHAILINAARGGLVDEQGLKLALTEGRLAGAAFDVFEVEPPQDRELLALPNFFATPHIGGSAKEAILAMGRAAIAGLDENQLIGDDQIFAWDQV